MAPCPCTIWKSICICPANCVHIHRTLTSACADMNGQSGPPTWIKRSKHTRSQVPMHHATHSRCSTKPRCVVCNWLQSTCICPSRSSHKSGTAAPRRYSAASLQLMRVEKMPLQASSSMTPYSDPKKVSSSSAAGWSARSAASWNSLLMWSASMQSPAPKSHPRRTSLCFCPRPFCTTHDNQAICHATGCPRVHMH